MKHWLLLILIAFVLGCGEPPLPDGLPTQESDEQPVATESAETPSDTDSSEEGYPVDEDNTTFLPAVESSDGEEEESAESTEEESAQTEETEEDAESAYPVAATPEPVSPRPEGEGEGDSAESTNEAVESRPETTYTIQPGDMLGFIAQDFNVTVDELLAANNLADANDIKAGQELIIPATGGDAAMAEEEPATEDEAASEEATTEDEAAAEETTDEVASEEAGSDESMAEAGESEADSAENGEAADSEAADTDESTDEVAETDSANADSTEADSADAEQTDETADSSDSADEAAGDETANEATEETADSGEGEAATNEGEQSAEVARPQTYVVQPGDSLGGIAERFGVSLADLAAANGLTVTSFVYVDQVLVIPGEEGVGQQTYVVQAGDTLRIIADRFGTTIDAIAAANGITNINSIYVGQVLVIPAP